MDLRSPERVLFPRSPIDLFPRQTTRDLSKAPFNRASEWCIKVSSIYNFDVKFEANVPMSTEMRVIQGMKVKVFCSRRVFFKRVLK